MGSVGDAHDNAMAESCFATLESELLERRSFKSQAEAQVAVFDFIEGWYNPHRRHSALGYHSPVEFERHYHETHRVTGMTQATTRPRKRGTPAEHWIHIRSTNVIELTFATIRHRADRTKGCLTRVGILAMMFKLGMSAQQHGTRLRGFEWLAKVIDGVKFRNGVQVQEDKRTSRRQKVSRVAA